MIDFLRIRELLHTVPRPPDDPLPIGLGDDECDKFEKSSGITLPKDVRDWLKIANGPCVGPGGFFGIQPSREHLDIDSFLSMFPSWKVRKWIPIAGDGCGNYYVVPTQNEFGNGFPVLFIDISFSTNEPSYIVASDIGHFIVSLLEKELGKDGWPFNKKAVIQSDPKIISFHSVVLPWESP